MNRLRKLGLAIALSILISPFLQAQTNIVGGEVAEPEAYPWMVTLITDWGIQGCGASLIHPQWVLTAAHCIPDFNGAPENIQVLINSVVTDPSDIEPYSELIDIEEIIIYPGWDWFLGQPDLALIRLAEPAITQPVLLATEDDADMFAHGMPAIALGWGITETEGEDSDSLLVAHTAFVGMSECLDLYSDSELYFGMEQNADSLICAVYINEDSEVVGAALGDSGGPLLFEEDGIHKQVGVVSFGESDVTLEDYPGVYTLINPFLDWIESTIDDFEPTSVSELNAEDLDIKYFANERIAISNLSAQNQYTLSAYGISGQALLEQKVVNGEELVLDLAGFESGFYLLQVFNESKGLASRMKFFVNK